MDQLLSVLQNICIADDRETTKQKQMLQDSAKTVRQIGESMMGIVDETGTTLDEAGKIGEALQDLAHKIEQMTP